MSTKKLFLAGIGLSMSILLATSSFAHSHFYPVRPIIKHRHHHHFHPRRHHPRIHRWTPPRQTIIVRPRPPRVHYHP